MKLVLNLSLLLFYMFIFGDSAFSLTDYQIKRICEKKIMRSKCMENLREKRSNLQKGKVIEIPVRPFRR